MAKYCVSRKSLTNGDHEVHNLDANCPYLPNTLNQIPLGDHETCATAVEAARILYDTANGCYNCSTGCHTLGGVRAAQEAKAAGTWTGERSIATSPPTNGRPH